MSIQHTLEYWSTDRWVDRGVSSLFFVFSDYWINAAKNGLTLLLLHNTPQKKQSIRCQQGSQTWIVGFKPTQLSQFDVEPCSVFQQIDIICRGVVSPLSFSPFPRWAIVYIPLLDWVCLNNLLLKQLPSSLRHIVHAIDFSQSRTVLWKKKKKKTRQESGMVRGVLRQRKGSRYGRNSLPEGQGSNYRGSCWDTES